MDTYHIDMRAYRTMGKVWLGLCAAIAIASFLAQLYWHAAVAALFCVVGIYMALNAGSLDLGPDGLIHNSSLGVWQIRWDEITAVEVGEMDSTMVLHGDNKRFILSSPAWWTGEKKEEAAAFIFKQLESRHLPPQLSKTASYKTMKNTRRR